MNAFAKFVEWMEEKSDKLTGRRTKKERFYGHLECAAAHAKEAYYLGVEARISAARKFCPVREEPKYIAQQVEYIYEMCLYQAVAFARSAAKQGKEKEMTFYIASARSSAYHLERQVQEEEFIFEQ